jgi:hypothetical protein
MAFFIVFDPNDPVVQKAIQNAVTAALKPVLDSIASLSASLTQKVNTIMSTLDDDIAAIAAQTTAVGSLATFIQGLQAQIAALPGLTAAQQAQIDAIFTSVSANTSAITSAMAANVPPTPAPAA